MTYGQIYDIVAETATKRGQPLDGLIDEITDRIIEDNGFFLAQDEVEELTKQFFEEEEVIMGSIGTGSTSNSNDTFTYVQSPDIKDWTDAEDKRSREMSRYVNDKIFEGSYQEYYEENALDTVETFEINGQGVLKDDTVTVDKMNLIYAQNWDENERRVKQGKAVTGSTYYVVQDENGAIDETNFAYKTKADAIHAAKLYVDRQKQLIEYYKRRKSNG